MGYVYLIHFERPVNGMRHYTGYAEDFEERIAAHRASRGSRLTKAANEQGVHWIVVRVWQGMNWQDEIQLKSFSNKNQCPVCKQKAKDMETFKRRGTSRRNAPPKILAMAKDSEKESSTNL